MHSAAPDDVNEDELSDGEGAAPRKYEPFESRLTENAARLLGTLGDALAQRRVPPAARSVPARLQWAVRRWCLAPCSAAGWTCQVPCSSLVRRRLATSLASCSCCLRAVP
jgi:hypothetical protein